MKRRDIKMSAVKILTVLVLTVSLFYALVGAHEVKGVCLGNERHKAKPSPEDDSYKGCRVFQNSSCCTSDFANQVTDPVIKGIGNFSWTLCGNLSRQCQEYMVGVECFYSCSPYVGLWANPNDTKAFINAPVCSGYCDSWYEACKDDLTCAKNWGSGFNYTSDGHNKCKRNCSTFKETYTNGKDLCESMWGSSFKYTEDQDRCLHFRYNASHNPNKDVVQKIFGHPESPTTTPATQGSTLGSTQSSTTDGSQAQGTRLSSLLGGLVLVLSFHRFFF